MSENKDLWHIGEWTFWLDMDQMGTGREKVCSGHWQRPLIQICFDIHQKNLIQGHYLNHRVKLVTDWVTGERNTFWTSNVEQRTCQTGHYTGHPEAFSIFMEHVPSNMKTELSTLINFISMMNMANTHSTVHIRSTVALIWCINNDILSLWLFCTLFKYFTINFVINIL